MAGGRIDRVAGCCLGVSGVVGGVFIITLGSRLRTRDRRSRYLRRAGTLLGGMDRCSLTRGQLRVATKRRERVHGTLGELEDGCLTTKECDSKVSGIVVRITGPGADERVF